MKSIKNILTSKAKIKAFPADFGVNNYYFQKNTFNFNHNYSLNDVDFQEISILTHKQNSNNKQKDKEKEILQLGSASSFIKNKRERDEKATTELNGNNNTIAINTNKIKNSDDRENDTKNGLNNNFLNPNKTINLHHKESNNHNKEESESKSDVNVDPYPNNKKTHENKQNETAKNLNFYEKSILRPNQKMEKYRNMKQVIDHINDNSESSNDERISSTNNDKPELIHAKNSDDNINNTQKTSSIVNQKNNKGIENRKINIEESSLNEKNKNVKNHQELISTSTNENIVKKNIVFDSQTKEDKSIHNHVTIKQDENHHHNSNQNGHVDNLTETKYTPPNSQSHEENVHHKQAHNEKTDLNEKVNGADFNKTTNNKKQPQTNFNFKKIIINKEQYQVSQEINEEKLQVHQHNHNKVANKEKISSLGDLSPKNEVDSDGNFYVKF